MKIVKSEILSSFQGEDNVRHIIDDKGMECWLTPEVSFNDVANAVGACKFNTIENERKHVLFLFNSDDKEVGRLYLGKKLHGKTPAQIVGLKNDLVIFKSWNLKTNTWVPCVGLSKKKSNKEKLSKSISINKRYYYAIFEGDNSGMNMSDDNNLSITCPRSYSIEIDRVKACKMTTIEEDNKHVLLLKSSDDTIVGTYKMSKKLWGTHAVPLHMHRFSLAFFEVFDTNTEIWESCVGYKQDVYSLYYNDAIMSLIRNSWDSRFDNSIDFDKEFDTALYNIDIFDLQILKEICQTDNTDYLGIKYGLLEWDLHKKNGELVCKEYGYNCIEMMLTGFEKRLFFWSFLLKEKRRNSKRYLKKIPIEYQSYSEDNLKKIIDYYHTHSKHQWSIADSTTHNEIDAETAIMSALKNGDGDSVGY